MVSFHLQTCTQRMCSPQSLKCTLISWYHDALVAMNLCDGWMLMAYSCVGLMPVALAFAVFVILLLISTLLRSIVHCNDRIKTICQQSSLQRIFHWCNLPWHHFLCFEWWIIWTLTNSTINVCWRTLLWYFFIEGYGWCLLRNWFWMAYWMSDYKIKFMIII